MLSRDCDGCESLRFCAKRYKKAQLHDKVYCPDGTAHLIDNGALIVNTESQSQHSGRPAPK